MPRLPIPGKDSGTWGSILNDYLSQTHKSDGTLKDDSVGSAQLANNAVTNSAIAPDAITATEIQDGSIQEAQLASTVQTKLNATAGTPEWDDITNKPTVIASGADQASARSAIGAGTSNLSLGTTSVTAKAGDYQPTSTDISDSTITGRSLLTAASATAAKTTLSLAKSDVDLGNVDNTSDATKNSAVATLTNKTLTDPRVNSIKDINGNTAINLINTTNAVNFLKVVNSSTGSPPIIQADGADTDINLMLRPKNNGTVRIQDANGSNVLMASGVASAVNYVRLTNAATANSPSVSAIGSDANVDLLLNSKGTGLVKANNSEVTTVSAAQTLTNKTISGSNNTISNIAQSSVTDLTTDLAARQLAADLGVDTATLANTDGSELRVAIENILGNYEAEALALFDRMTVRPDTDHRAAINTLIATLKVSGIWDKLDGLYLLAAHTQQAALLNWKSSNYNLTAYNSPTFTADRGIAGGATAYLQVPGFSGAALTMAQNDECMGLWTRTNVAEDINSFTLATTSGGTSSVRYLNPRQTATSVAWRINSDAVEGTAALASGDNQCICASRSDNTTTTLYLNGAANDTHASASQNDPRAQTFYPTIGRVSGNYTTRQHGAAWYGAALDSSQNAQMYNALYDYMTALGAV